MKFSKNVVYVKKRSKEQIAQMEKEFSYCQEHLDDEKCKEQMWKLFWEALRIVITKRTKATDVYLWSWADRITDGTAEFMQRYKKNPNYRVPYLFKAASWMSLKILYQKNFRKKYENKDENFETLENCSRLSYNTFEDDILDKLEKEGY